MRSTTYASAVLQCTLARVMASARRLQQEHQRTDRVIDGLQADIACRPGERASTVTDAMLDLLARFGCISVERRSAMARATDVAVVRCISPAGGGIVRQTQRRRRHGRSVAKQEGRNAIFRVTTHNSKSCNRAVVATGDAARATGPLGGTIDARVLHL